MNRITTLRLTKSSRGIFLLGLILAQALCAAFFLYDVVTDIIEGHSASAVYLIMESLATITLIAAAVMEARAMRHLTAERAQNARSMTIARGQIQSVIDAYFVEWLLTPAETDVAALTIKGLSITEIAEMRQSREGTVKTHLNAIYRKAGVSGRAQLVSLLIEDLMDRPLLPDPAAV